MTDQLFDVSDIVALLQDAESKKSSIGRGSMAEVPVPHGVRVRLRWSDGRTEMLLEKIDWMKSEIMLPDADGKMHRFKDIEK